LLSVALAKERVVSLESGVFFSKIMESAIIPGEYYLQGMREMASGFLLKPDHSFQFFFTYGALDRVGSGKWEEANGRLLLNSLAKPPNGYTLVKSGKREHDFIHIVLEGNNPMAMRHTFVSLDNGAEGSWKQMSQQGDVQFPQQEVRSISLLLEFCPERIAAIPVADKDHNEFIFRLEPSIIEIFFDNFSLQAEPDALTGGHPLMEGNTFRYSKQ